MPYPYGYVNGADAGTQVSSTYEGRHIIALESDVVHPTHADGFVDKGDPVLFNDVTVDAQTGVGVALQSATAATDYINLDTEGIWNLAVVAQGDITGAIANDDIVYGDQIFINITTGVLSKIRNANTNRPFGYSLNHTTVAGASGATVIPVKVHWDPYWSEVARPLCGVSGAPYVNDTAGTIFRQFRYDCGATSGDARAEYIRLYITGAGGGGEAMRIFTTVEDVAGNTARGAHISLNFNDTGSITGLGTAVSATLHIANQAYTGLGGTYASVEAQIWSDGANTDPAGMTQLSFIRCVNGGNAGGIADVDDDAYLLVLTGGTIGNGNIVEAAVDETEYAWNARCLLPGGQVAYMMFASARA